MRHAPWILWIQDLSAPDPWFILPVVMTATSWFQTWLNPTPPDPMQAKLMVDHAARLPRDVHLLPGRPWCCTGSPTRAVDRATVVINKRLGVLGKK